MGSYSKPGDKRGRIRNLSVAFYRHRGRQRACTHDTGGGRGKRDCAAPDAFSNGLAAARVYGAKGGAAADGSINAAARRSTSADTNGDGAGANPCTYCV